MAVTETKAWYFETFGKAEEVLKFGTVKLQPLGDEEVQVAVKAAALNPVDALVMEGYFEASKVKHPTIPAWDFAGVVTAVGSKVSKWKVEDSVYGLNPDMQFGVLAQHVNAHADEISSKPSNLSFEEAASLPVALLTPYKAFQVAGLKGGDKVLITAGAGGVGVCAIQLAKVVFQAGEIATTASRPKHAVLEALGATKTIDYKKDKFEDILSDYDVVLDSTMEAGKCLQVAKPNGKVVTITSFDAKPPVIIFQLIRNKKLGSDLDQLNPYLLSGEIKPVLDETSPWSFDKAKEAFTHMNTKSVLGKLVVKVE